LNITGRPAGTGFETWIEGNAYDARIVLADADGHSDGLLWIPYILNRCQVRGLGGAMANPSRNDKPHAEWATRLMFAHDNAVENLVMFAPLVLILNAIDYSRNGPCSPARFISGPASRI
jgi:hypothetical protein